MNIKKYIDYFKYIIGHKKNVFIKCINMSRKFGDTAESFYLKNYNKIELNHDNRLFLEHQLNIIAPMAFTCECDEGYWMTLKELIEYSLEWEDRNKQNSCWLREQVIPWYKEKDKLDLLSLVEGGDK